MYSMDQKGLGVSHGYVLIYLVYKVYILNLSRPGRGSSIMG